MKYLYPAFLIVCSLCFAGCSKYGSVTLKYPTPPAAIIPSEIKTIALANRCLTPKENTTNVVSDMILSGEVAGSDKKASEECLKAVSEDLNGFHDINIIYAPNYKMLGTGTREIPGPLSWTRVREICDSSKADALLVLEMFDSNSDVILGNVMNTVGSVITTGTVAPPNPSQNIRMNVTGYWRLYDPHNEKIIDQYQSFHQMTFATSNPINIPPPEALPQTAHAAGDRYSDRFLPGYYYVRREMYKRGKGAYKEKFRTAFRKSEVADWEGAAAVWGVIANTATGRTAGRACLDMAVSCEVLGHTKDAVAWAKKGYEDFGNKLCRDYANTLRRRLNEE
ncbi:MAG: DUF6340 family protein [Bacteroidia bacterium]